MKKADLKLDRDIFEKLWQDRELFSKRVGYNVTWGNYLLQLELCSEVVFSLPHIKARRYSPYVYGVYCPKCGIEDISLRRLNGIVIWKVKCAKCCTEFIAYVDIKSH